SGTVKSTFNDGGAISGSGNLIVTNSLGVPNTLTGGIDTYQLSGNNSGYSGNITVSGAVRLQPTTANGLGSGNVTIADGAEVFFSAAGTYNNNFTMTGVGTMVDLPPLGAIRMANTQTLGGTIT